jgi:hypothetical protein
MCPVQPNILRLIFMFIFSCPVTVDSLDCQLPLASECIFGFHESVYLIGLWGNPLISYEYTTNVVKLNADKQN